MKEMYIRCTQKIDDSAVNRIKYVAIAGILMLVILIASGISLTKGPETQRVSATSDNKFETKELGYEVITLSTGATIWDVAQEYIDRTNYSDVREFIKYIAKANNIKNANAVEAGRTIIIPCYPAE